MARASTIDVVIKGEYSDKDILRAIGDLQKLQASSVALSTRFAALGTKMQSVGKGISSVGKSLTLGVTLPIVGIGTAAVLTQAEFETAMKSLQVNAGATETQMKSLSKLALQMGADTVFSAGEAANAMLELAKGGLSVADIEAGALAASMNLAATEGMDLSRSAEIIVQAMNTFGLSASDTGTAVDLLAAGAVASTAGVEDLAGGLKFVGTTASQFGIGLADSVTALAALNNAGIDATTAGTSLNRFMLGLVGTTKKSSAAIKEYGLEFFNAQGQMRPMTEIIGELDSTLAGLSDQQRAQVLKDIFGIEGMRAANVLLQQGVDGFNSLSDAVNQQGIAQELASARMSGTAGAIEQLRGSLESAAIVIGEALAPTIQNIAASIQSLVDRFTNLSPATQQMIIVFAGIAAAVGPVLLIVGKLVIAAGALIKVVAGIGAVFTPVGAIIAAVVIGIVALVAAFKLAWDNSATLREAVGNLWSALQTLASTLMNAVKRAFSTVLGEGNSFGNVLRTIGDVLGRVFSVAINIATTAVRGLTRAIELGSKAFEVVWTVISMAANLLRGVFALAIDVVMNRLGPLSTLLQTIASRTTSAFQAVVGAVRSAFNSAAGAIENVVNTVIGAINGLIDVYNAMARFLPGVSQATRIAEFRFNELSGAVQHTTTKVYDANAAQKNYTGSALSFGQATKNNADTMNTAGVAADSYASKLGGATGATKKNAEETDNATKKLDRYKAKFDEVAAGLKAAREAIEADYKSMFTTVQNAITGSLSLEDALPEYNEAGERVGMSFIEKLTEQANKAVAFAAKIKELIALGLKPEALSMVVQAGVDAGTLIANELIGGGATAIDQTNALIDTTKKAGDDVGLFAADSFYGAGLALAKQTEDAFQKRFGEGGPGWNKMNRLMNWLAKSMERTTTITVETRHVTVGVPGRRMGGPVAAGSPYIVGEAGPELFVPTITGRIIPNHDISGSMTGRGGSVSMGGGGTTINVNVNAGMGTNGAEVGRQIADALKAYERRNGPVYVAA